MKKKRRWIKTLIYTFAGALAGTAYYYLIGCKSGSCPLTGNLLNSALYMGTIGSLLSVDGKADIN